MLYALGVGAGASDYADVELAFVTGNSEGVTVRALPTFPTVVEDSDEVFASVGDFDPAMRVHAEQRLELYEPVPSSGTVGSVTTITGIYDKGSGALVEIQTRATDASTGRELWSMSRSTFIRGEGGFGGPRGASRRLTPPAREPDRVVTLRTHPEQALIYRLSGDCNPLHSDPSVAVRSGFDRPILHGLCTFGFTGRALLHAVCESNPDRFVSLDGRFSRPVTPGQALDVLIWGIDGQQARFQTVTDKGVVIDMGTFVYR
jgi:acyl dehydratase